MNVAPTDHRRSDARANRVRVLEAARACFADDLDAQMLDVARRAGVGVGTVYRHFENKQALQEALAVFALETTLACAREGLAIDDPWEGFASYLERSCQLQAADRGLNDVMGMRFPRATATEAAKTRLYELVGQVLDRAQQCGQLRTDLTLEDLAFLNWANTRILPAVRSAGAPDAWRRYLGLLLDGFRAERAHPLPPPPLSPRQVHRAMVTLGRRSTGDPH